MTGKADIIADIQDRIERGRRELGRQDANGADDDDALRPGDRVPTIRQLAAQYGVTPRTAHEAWRVLQARGLVVKLPGRGTIVNPAPWSLTPERRFEQQRAGLGPLAVGEHVRMIGAEWVGGKDGCDSETRKALAALDLPPNASTLRREVTTSQNDRPISRTVTWLPRRVVRLIPRLGHDEAVMIEGTVTALENAGVRCRRPQSHVEARFANERESELLGVSTRDPVLAFVSLTVDHRNRPVEYLSMAYRAGVGLSL